MPPGDIVLSSFPKIIDCQDIQEVICELWCAEVDQMRKKKTIDTLINKTFEFVGKIYPVLFSDGFGMSAANQMESALGNDELYRLR